MTIIRQNIAAALLVKAIFLALTAVGVTNLWFAVLADVGMSLVVTLNSVRLIRISNTSQLADVPVPDAMHMQHGTA